MPSGLIHDNTLIIAADTLVVVDRLILGKPSGSEEARGMLRMLSGKEHEVVTGVCLREKSRFHSFSVSSKVRFKPLPEEEIEYYIKACQPYDKAGAYGIQEWIGYTGVEHIEGSFFNVMGLPTYRLWEEMKRFVSLKGEPG